MVLFRLLCTDVLLLCSIAWEVLHNVPVLYDNAGISCDALPIFSVLWMSKWVSFVQPVRMLCAYYLMYPSAT
jgi:hypothetical protein